MTSKIFCHFCGGRLTKKFHEGRTRLFCDDCRSPIYENPVPANCLVTVDDLERVLLVKRSVDPKRGFWCLPGGFMEMGETPEAGALRELMEETGLSGKIDRLLGVTVNPSPRYDTVLMIGYLVRSYNGAPIAGDDADAVGWFAQKDLPEIAFDSHKKFIHLYYAAYAHPDPSNP